ncbi:MAG TPA: hypothetical protein VGR16_01835 [Thermomicrobiales bacterium]|nr:hypothetical protein [Thermomicrobiales bacterium]
MSIVLPRSRNKSLDRRLAARVREVLGEELALAIASGPWPGDRAAGSPDMALEVPVGEARLGAALSIADMLREVEATPTVRGWFAGKNPMLGDRAPAVVLASDPEGVRLAACDFLAHG